MGVKRTSATADTVAVATTDVDLDPPLIVEEDELQGVEIDTAYTSGQLCFMRVAYPGDEFLLLVVAGQNIAKGDYLTPDGTGKWKKVASTEAKVFQASEALNVSASGAADDHVLAEKC